MIEDFPGKILFFDDREEDVKNHIQEFRDQGYGVKYFSELPSEDEIPSSVRLVVTDLDLDACGEVTDEDLELLTECLIRIEKKSSFYLISIFSGVQDRDFEENIVRVKEKYLERTGNPLKAEFLKTLKKSEYNTKLKETLEEWIMDNSHSGVIIEWEKIIEKAKDACVSSIVNAGEIRHILLSMKGETSEIALTRETLQLFNRILLRYSCLQKNNGNFETCVQKVASDTAPLPEGLTWYSNIHFLNNYYYVEDEEPSPGDIYCTNEDDKLKKYVIIITPICDIAQKKAERLKVIYGWPIEKISEYNIEEPDSIPEIVKLCGKNSKGKYVSRSEFIKKITTDFQNLSERFFLMHFVRLNKDDTDYSHIVFDFQNNGSVGTFPSWWDHICRVDSPQFDHLIQKYVVYSSRLGVNAIPEKILESEKSRLSSIR